MEHIILRHSQELAELKIRISKLENLLSLDAKTPNLDRAVKRFLAGDSGLLNQLYNKTAEKNCQAKNTVKSKKARKEITVENH